MLLEFNHGESLFFLHYFNLGFTYTPDRREKKRGEMDSDRRKEVSKLLKKKRDCFFIERSKKRRGI